MEIIQENLLNSRYISQETKRQVLLRQKIIDVSIIHYILQLI